MEEKRQKLETSSSKNVESSEITEENRDNKGAKTNNHLLGKRCFESSALNVSELHAIDKKRLKLSKSYCISPDLTSFKSLKRSKSFNFILSDSNRSTMKIDFFKNIKTENLNNVEIGRSKHRKNSLNDNPNSSRLDTFDKNEKILLRCKALKRKW